MMPKFKTSKLELVQLDPPPGFRLSTLMRFYHLSSVVQRSSESVCVGGEFLRSFALKASRQGQNIENIRKHCTARNGDTKGLE